MLSSHLGVETFLNGVTNYLKKHAYGNATTEDLWAALGESAGTDVAEFMVISLCHSEQLDRH
jgi:aminopeptidase N